MIKAFSALRTWLLYAMIEPTDVEITIRLRSAMDARRFSDAVKDEFHHAVLSSGPVEDFKLFGFQVRVRSGIAP